jgi:hypothetical protein
MVVLGVVCIRDGGCFRRRACGVTVEAFVFADRWLCWVLGRGVPAFLLVWPICGKAGLLFFGGCPWGSITFLPPLLKLGAPALI